MTENQAEPREQDIMFQVNKAQKLSDNGAHGSPWSVSVPRATLMEKARMEVHSLIARHRLTPYTVRCDALCYVRLPKSMSDRQQFDADNMQPTFKPLLDGIIKGGLFPDDSFQYIRRRSFEYDPRPTGRKGVWELEIHFIPLTETWKEYRKRMESYPMGYYLPACL